MMSSLFQSGSTPLLRQVARFAEKRQEALAGNIANIDTPGYRMRDLKVDEFQKALKAAIARSQPAPASPSAGQLAVPTGFESAVTTMEDLFPHDLFTASALDEQAGITFQDANNRSVEHQVMQMTQNSILQNFALQLLNGQYAQLEHVIREQVS